jgi:hypothetical protein
MRRLAFALVFAVLTSTILAGCGGGLQEGMSKEPAPPTGQPPGFAKEMERMSKDMQLKNARPQVPPKGTVPP